MRTLPNESQPIKTSNPRFFKEYAGKPAKNPKTPDELSVVGGIFLMEANRTETPPSYTNSYTDSDTNSYRSRDVSPLTSSSEASEPETRRYTKHEPIDPTYVTTVARRHLNPEQIPERIQGTSDRNPYPTKKEVINPVTQFKDAYVGGIKGDRHQFPKELEKSLPNPETKNETPEIEEEPVSVGSSDSALASSEAGNSDTELMFEMEI